MSDQPFNPDDPFNAASDDFRRQVMLMAADAFETPPFSDLDPDGKIAALSAASGPASSQ